MAGLGELAAFGTAVGWSVSSYVHGIVGQMVGARSVTLLRLPYQMILLTVLCVGIGVETPLDPESVLYLFLSGFIGVSLCDFMLYQAITIVGPQTAILVLSLSSSFTAVIGFCLLGEVLALRTVAGIAMTTLGVIWVLAERTGSTLLPGQEPPKGRRLATGIALSVGAAVTLALSFIFLKMALRTGMPPLWAALVRIACAAAVLWGTGLFKGWSMAAVSDMRAQPRVFWILLSVSAFSAAGMWFSSVAMSMIPAGVAATIIGLQPIIVAIVGAVWCRRVPSRRVVSGTLVAFCGTALVCLR